LNSLFNPTSIQSPIIFASNKLQSIQNIVANDTAARRPLVLLTRTFGTITSPTSVTSGAILGNIRMVGYDATSLISAGDIEVGVEGAVSTGVLPSYMSFSTTATSSLAERMRITSIGNVGIGITTPTAKLHVSTSGQALNSIFAPVSVVDAILYSGTKRLVHRMVVSNDTALVRPLINFQRTGGSNTSPTSVTNGTHLGSIVAAAYDGTSIINGTDITSIVNGTVSTGVVPSDMVFSTTATNTLIERMRINSSGNVGIGVTAPTAILHLKAGTATASTASLKIPAGTFLTTKENGAVENNGNNFTVTNNSVRYNISNLSGSVSTTGTATTTFTVTIGQTMPNTTYKPFISASNALSSTMFYISNKTTTTFDVVFATALTGTVAFDWELIP